MNWRKIVALAAPLALLFFAAGFFAYLEVRRGPDWRLELDEYLAQHVSPSETVRIQKVTRARSPENFRAGMGTPQPGDWIVPSFPPRAVRCVLLLRSPTPDAGGAGESLRQLVFLVHHSDALYRVGWLAYEGPMEPFGPEVLADLASIGCDLGLE